MISPKGWEHSLPQSFSAVADDFPFPVWMKHVFAKCDLGQSGMIRHHKVDPGDGLQGSSGRGSRFAILSNNVFELNLLLKLQLDLDDEQFIKFIWDIVKLWNLHNTCNQNCDKAIKPTSDDNYPEKQASFQTEAGSHLEPTPFHQRQLNMAVERSTREIPNLTHYSYLVLYHTSCWYTWGCLRFNSSKARSRMGRSFFLGPFFQNLHLKLTL